MGFESALFVFTQPINHVLHLEPGRLTKRVRFSKSRAKYSLCNLDLWRLFTSVVGVLHTSLFCVYR